MACQCKRTGWYSRPSRRPLLLSALVAIVAVLVLAACGGGGTSATVTNAPAATTVPVIASATSVVRQGGSLPTSAPSATSSASAAPTAIANIAAATKPAVAPNANAGAVTTRVDPCTLITKTDYLAVMGDAANDPEKKDRPTASTSGFSQTSCTYKIAAGNKVEFVTVNVMQRDVSAPARLDMPTYWDGTKKAWASMQAKVTPLPEIGPEVFLVVNPLLEQIGGGGAVHFYKGDVIFNVQAVTGSGTVDEQNAAGTVAAKKLATLAFARL